MTKATNKTTKFAFQLTLFAATLIGALHADPALAQRQRVYVSVNGFDTGTCPPPPSTPCRTFQYAHDQVLAGGEIIVLDTGGYGAVIINKAVSINAPTGIEANIAAASGGTGITINAQGTDKVALRGLTLDGAGVASIGIAFNSGKALTITDCVVRNVINYGVNFAPNQTTAAGLVVSNSYFNDSGFGVVIQALNQGAITAAIDRTGFSGNVSDGLDVQGVNGTGSISVAVTDSVAANNTIGYVALSTTGHSVTGLSLTHSLAAGNGTGIFAQGPNAAIWLAQSTATGNATLYNVNPSGAINSYGDNFFAADNGSGTGTLNSATKQ